METRENLGRLYFKLQRPDNYWEIPYAAWVWLGDGETAMKKEGKDSFLTLVRPLDTNQVIRVNLSHVVRQMPELLQTMGAFFFSDIFIEALIKAGIDFKFQEVLLVDIEGQPLKKSKLDSIGKKYFFIPLPKSEIIPFGLKVPMRLHYFGTSDLFSYMLGTGTFLTFPVLNVIYKMKWKNFRADNVFPQFPYPIDVNKDSLDESIARKNEALQNYNYDLNVPAKEWPGSLIQHALELGYCL